MIKENKPKFLRILSSGVLCLALMFALLEMSNFSETVDRASYVYFALSLFCLTVYEITSFVYLRKSAPKRSDFILLVYASLCLVAVGFAVFTPKTSALYTIAPVLYLTVPMIKRILTIVRKRKSKSKVYDILVLIVNALFLLGTIAIGTTLEDGSNNATTLFACMIIILSCLTNICLTVFSQFNKDILLRIMKKTYAGEILLGLFLLMIAFSLVLMHNEDSIHTFEDALWYCFAVITTIGFGDFAAVTAIGRILTVILGVYGIIVVSILTSIIVNFYGEVRDKKEDIDETQDVEKTMETQEAINSIEDTCEAQEEKSIDAAESDAPQGDSLLEDKSIEAASSENKTINDDME